MGQMKQLDFPKETRVIDVHSIELREKDLIVIENFEDFKWLTRNDAAIWKLKDHYYALDSSVAYIFFNQNK